MQRVHLRPGLHIEAVDGVRAGRMLVDARLLVHAMFLPEIQQDDSLVERVHLLLVQYGHIHPVLKYYSDVLTLGSSLILRLVLPGASKSLMLSL